MATKQPVQIADVVNEPHYFDVPSGYSAVLLAKLSGARTVLAVPMLKENELKQFPAYLNRWDSQQARNEGVFGH
jgi:hypothetical protein